MSWELERECSICGARITDNNPDGIGFDCREVYYKAKSKTYFEFYGLDHWKKSVEFYVSRFLDTFKDVKFRSSFRKSFYSSIKERYESSDCRISKKQIHIMADMLYSKDEDFFDSETDFKEQQKSVVRDYCPNQVSNKKEYDYMLGLSKRLYSATIK